MFFSKKPKGPQKKYIAYMDKLSKYRNVMKLMASQPGTGSLMVYFFDQTRSELQVLGKALGIHFAGTGEPDTAGIHLQSAFQLGEADLSGINHVVCMEVHPLSSVHSLVEKAFASRPEVVIHYYLGMDETALEVFGSGRIVDLMKKMGMQDDEPIEHDMVSKSIERGLEKLEKDIPQPRDIRSSPQEWRAANIPA